MKYLLITFLCLVFFLSSAQNKHDIKLKFLFYNVENLFDNKDDTLTNDAEFLPFGARSWTWRKYINKCNKISQTIFASADWNAPDLIGLCEIENRKVLNTLVYNTPLKVFKYKIIHHESPDHRGIDVAILYSEKNIKALETNFIALKDANGRILATREILYFKALLVQTDTIHVFVNHWPSRWGGTLNTEHKRLLAAKTLRHKIDSILNINAQAKIICMGDFNDTPHDKSIVEILKAKEVNIPLRNEFMYNLSYSCKNSFLGTHKYKSSWNFIDQFIVSSQLLNSSKGIYCLKNDMTVIEKSFLLEYDTKYLSYKPYRTFIGFRYRNAFSDHLPIMLSLRFKK